MFQNGTHVFFQTRTHLGGPALRERSLVIFITAVLVSDPHDFHHSSVGTLKYRTLHCTVSLSYTFIFTRKCPCNKYRKSQKTEEFAIGINI